MKAKLKGSAIKRRKDSEIKRRKDSEIKRRKDSAIKRRKDSVIKRRKDSVIATLILKRYLMMFVILKKIQSRCLLMTVTLTSH
jgi:hypothetical protein